MHSSIPRTILAVALLLVLAGVPPSSAQSKPPSNAVSALGGLSQSFEAIADAVSPAVVQIVASGYTPSSTNGASAATLLTKRSSGGSGVILDPSGYIVTNAHVVEGARQVQVLLSTPPEGSGPQRSILKPMGNVLNAQIIGVDLETDLAVLKIDGSELPYLEFGDSDELRSGQLVLAFGSPLGLENSVTMGVVSAVARQFTPEDPMIYIQTDAPINPGNSGGPLINVDGQVVGINTIMLSQGGGSEGLGFASPSNIVKNVYEQIRDGGYVRRGVIGVHAQTISPTMAAGLGLSRDWGVILGDVYLDSPAEKAGLGRGDIILALNDKIMENGRQFDVNLYSRRAGDEVRLDVLRGLDQLVITVAVVERDDGLDRFGELVTPDRNLVPRLGILGLDLNPAIAAMLPNLRGTDGVVVAARAAGSTHWEDGFRLGDVIHSINRQSVTNLEDLREVTRILQSGDAVVAHVERQGKMRYVAFHID